MFHMMLKDYHDVKRSCLVLFAGDDKAALTWVSLHPNMIAMLDTWFA
jgi:hypothetical protein